MLSKTNSSIAVHRFFLRVQNGKLTSSQGSFSCVSGVINSVVYKTHTDKTGQKYNNWHLLIDDNHSGEYYDIAFSEHCDAFGYILSALLTSAGQSSFGRTVSIDFSPYKVNGTMTIVSVDGQVIKPGERMPALLKTVSDGHTSYDGSARQAWLLSAMARVNGLLEHITRVDDEQ